MLNSVQRMYSFHNRNTRKIFVGESALEHNCLVYGNGTLCFYTYREPLNNTRLCGVMLEHYHFSGVDDCTTINLEDGLKCLFLIQNVL